MVKHYDLFKRLRSLGFPLLEHENQQDVNLALADVVRSRDMRLWEGFPVVLATGVSKNMFDYNKAKGYLKSLKERLEFELLVALSLAIYKTAGHKFAWADALRGLLSKRSESAYGHFLNALKNGSDIKLGAYSFSPLRLRTTFDNYFTANGQRLNELLQEKEDLGLEYAMSQVFSPKQKDLFLKKLKGEKLTKTEKEYFSRAVKKKVLALANPELHRLSQKLLG